MLSSGPGNPDGAKGGTDPAVKDSLHSIELSPVMKKKFLDGLTAPTRSVSKKQRAVPSDIIGKIKTLLLANKSGIWISRFLMEYMVSGVLGLP
jgi:hypothetical protein